MIAKVLCPVSEIGVINQLKKCKMITVALADQYIRLRHSDAPNGNPIRLTDRESRNSSKRRYSIEKTRTIANVYRHYINCHFYAIR